MENPKKPDFFVELERDRDLSSLLASSDSALRRGLNIDMIEFLEVERLGAGISEEGSDLGTDDESEEVSLSTGAGLVSDEEETGGV